MSVLPKPRKLRLRTVGRTAAPSSLRLRQRSEEDYARIDADTRLFVWKRDGGRCRNCGSTTDIQFDHIIPRSQGGSGRAVNVELLCGRCNNKKKARLATP
ncbi:HNH endonuclease [Mesorhizobium sp.]|uniref:HNH endonuclease n=1 Tax=Mesorhizobium sp. TaxID=1871066 RepID=UPI00120CE1E7|nr:MAG: HNH endonuclease [Mesorhizobium sp.]